MEIHQGKALVQLLSLACLGGLDDVTKDKFKVSLSIEWNGV